MPKVSGGGDGTESVAATEAGATDSLDQRGNDVPATLVFNPNAGSSAGIDPEALQSLLLDAGYDPVYRVTERPEDLDDLLAETEGVVIAAGGDGTFREVAKRLAGGDRPVSLLPMGTANNTARSLGIEGTVKRVIAGLADPRKVRLDLARASGPWGEELVVEGAGVGLFANLLSAYQPDVGKSVIRAIGAAANELSRDAPIRCVVELDGERLDGQYILVEALNMRAVGPRLTLAPEADPTDGLLDVVLVRHENRDALFAYIRRLLTSGLSELPSVELHRGRSLRLNWRASAFHVDALSFCKESREAENKAYSAVVEIVPGAIEVWLPARD